MIAHCGLEWDDACLEFYKTERPTSHRAALLKYAGRSMSRRSGAGALMAMLLQPLLEA